MTMTQLLLADVLRATPQFARSVNVERDSRVSDLKGYLPTQRAIDVLWRFTAALTDASITRAWSVTGPYGSGKSSLALLLDCLTGPADEKVRDDALALVSSVDEILASKVRAALDATSGADGFLRATVTAQREPIERTIVRAVATALGRFKGALPRRAALVKEAKKLLAAPLLSVREVADFVEAAAALAPILLVIDEFGKNLEFLADRPADADLFVLQEIVERSSGSSRSPVFLVTLQHLAFEDYAASATQSQRREWAKIQGRFEDVPFGDSPAEVIQLVARVFQRVDGTDTLVLAGIDQWAEAQYTVVEQLGLGDRLTGPELLSACYPLHPLALTVLPELCSRYGQRERTLFSFLARPEPYSVASFLEEQVISRGHVPVVGVERVFDYFVGTSGTIIATADGASRWVEIDSRIKETQGLSDEETRVMKVAGVLNLVSRGGTVRASRDALAYAAPDLDIDAILKTLQARGLLVYRGFADEFRVWQGTDFDLQSAINDAHRRHASVPLARVCERALPLSPLVAARHSQDKGVLRFFDRTYADASGLSRLPSSDADGVLLYMLDDTAPPQVSAAQSDSRPTILLYASDVGAVNRAARDAAAIADVLASSESLAEDWVARRELHERAALAAVRLREAFHSAFELDADGVKAVFAHGEELNRDGHRNWSAILSNVCDRLYGSAPTVRNEMIARRGLSSQAARARRDLLIAMMEHAGLEHLGIEGYGPERAMLDSILVYSGMYRRVGERWNFMAPTPDSDYLPAWQAMEAVFTAADTQRVTLDTLWRVLTAPPIGLPAGPIPVIVTAALLVHADDVAIYQDGTFQSAFGPDLIERMIKSPERFAVKHFATLGPRATVLTALAARLPPSALGRQRNATLIRVVAPLVRSARSLPDYALKTSAIDDEARAVRDALTRATEPDVLLFSALAQAVGVGAFAPGEHVTDRQAETYASRLMNALTRLEHIYPSLIDSVVNALARAFGMPAPTRLKNVRVEVTARCRGLVDKVTEPQLRSFLLAATDTYLEDQDWVENLAMNIAERPPRAWRDEDHQRFDAGLTDLLRAYRHVEILHLEHLDAHPADARARQVVVTTREGKVAESIVWLDDTSAEAVEEIIVAALRGASRIVGDRAPETLLAVLAERLMRDSALGAPDRRQPPLKEVSRRYA